MCNHSQGFYHAARRDEDGFVSDPSGVGVDTGAVQSLYPAEASEEPEQESWSMGRVQ